MNVDPPKVFVSHAGEDKHAFAEPLARKLREMGADAWLDKWEIAPGDSLVQKIFHEAMSQTDAVVVVLSRTSVAKPWVAKELDVAVVRNIQKLSRLIPVRIDDCEVPEVLRDLVWLDWTKEGGHEGVSKRIVETLFEEDKRPAVGTPPKHLEHVQFEVPGLTKKDSLLLQCLFEAALDGHREIMQTADIAPFAEAKDLSEEDLNESAEILLAQGYLWDKGSNLHHGYFVAEFPSRIFLQVAQANGHDISSLQRRIASYILNEDVSELEQLVEKSGQKRGIVEAILDDFEHQGFLKTIRTMGGMQGVYEIKALFKRWLAGGRT